MHGAILLRVLKKSFCNWLVLLYVDVEYHSEYAGILSGLCKFNKIIIYNITEHYLIPHFQNADAALQCCVRKGVLKICSKFRGEHPP